MNASDNAPAGHPIRWWEIVLVPLATFVVWLGLLVALGVGAGFAGSAFGLSPEEFKTMAERGEWNTPAVWLAFGTLYLAALIVLGFSVRGRSASLVATYSREVSRSQINRALVTGVLLAFAVVFILGYLEANKIVEFRETPSDKMLVPKSVNELLLILPVVGLLAPFVEEMYFRGLMLSWLQQSLPLALAALISSAIFAIAHAHPLIHPGVQGWVLTGVVGIVGLINAVWAQRSRSLWPPLTLHASYNSTFVLGAFAFG
ncbi:MAG: lysostaphin resistance A-like protein [Alphaproteobacteria bacterium]